MSISRRTLLHSGYVAGVSLTALAGFNFARGYSANAGLELVSDPNGILDLPKGYSYTVVSTPGEIMSDGFFRPSLPDGMACFPHPDDSDLCILTRNHEIWPNITDGSPFGPDNALLANLPEGKLYDTKLDGSPFFGGVTNVIYNLKEKRMERDFLTLTGTTANCAGGRTPWGTWLSCEEMQLRAPDEANKYHGFVFEVPADATGPVDPVPLKAMGRFAHEAAAVALETDIIYMTEDNRTGLFYRFVPNKKRRLEKGGRLQALVIKDWNSADTRNWPLDWSSGDARRISAGDIFEVEWIDLDDVEAPNADLAERGHAAGAAYFCRGEGIEYGIRKGERGSIFFNCTQGGVSRTGQVWQYTPSPREGRRREDREPGKLTLLYESPSADVLDLCDNLAIAPSGDLILCEDGAGDQYLRGLTQDGKIYDIARNAVPDKSEFCGACFSPDGKVMFVNLQGSGHTLAIEGPWSNSPV
ncbi:MAG: DUF839 domain-containing protein [Marinicaulis sp.]|nr:DUF839 domain-containing protein [Marinicaulis sp.]